VRPDSSPRIVILPDHLANKIAAGEVVQRPASVAKELLENSLDAGADEIEVVLEEGGTTLIKVVDDGEGMSPEDAVLALERHATSKIRVQEDLEAISTFGFRGEALPSIASVSRLTIKTRTEGNDTATVVSCSGGDRPEVSRDARARGTTVTVANLFYNVPARRKFLKSARTESRHVLDAIQRVAISHPHLRLRVMSDGEKVFDLNPGTLHERMIQVFGEKDVEGMIPVNESSEPIGITGYLGKPVVGKKSGGTQYLFLNGRPITSRNVNHAVMSAYEHLTLKHSYPFYVLLMEIDPRRVDVNVHPAKLEARFEDEQGLHRFVHSLVRKALSASGFVPALSLSESAEGSAGLRFSGAQNPWPQMSRPGVPGMAEKLYGQIPGGGPAEARQGGTPEDAGPQEMAPLSGPVWQLHNRYIVVQVEGGIMILDQHVAHERILYERVVERMRTRTSTSQQLLFSTAIQLNPGEAELMHELLPGLERLGLIARHFGGNTFVVESIPPELKPGDEERMLREILRSFRESQEITVSDLQDNLAKSFACKAAVKSGDPLNNPEMRFLVDNLFRTVMPYVCPHGRPTVVRLSLDELDRRFGRK
jgi:DNA mismatch repair protein MutL